jgi:acyl carrier protein
MIKPEWRSRGPASSRDGVRKLVLIEPTTGSPSHQDRELLRMAEEQSRTITGMNAEIRRVLREYARLPLDATTLDDHADLYLAGMSSHASVDVMIELEDTFGIEFPALMLDRSVFESIAAICCAISQLQAQAA